MIRHRFFSLSEYFRNVKMSNERGQRGEIMEKLTIGQATMTWLNGGITHLDGGAMFGVVPKRNFGVKEESSL